MQTNPGQFSNVFSSTTSILKNEGITAFWKGSVPTAFGMALENAMAFGVNEGKGRKHANNVSFMLFQPP